MQEITSAKEQYFKLLGKQPLRPKQKADAIFVLRNHDDIVYYERIRLARQLMLAGISNRTVLIWGDNTADEADRIIHMSLHQFGRLVLATDRNHGARVLLTVLRACENWSCYPAIQLALNPWGKLDEETDKIEEYQAKGDVASYVQGIEYLHSQQHNTASSGS